MKAKQYKQKTSLQSYKTKITILADPGLVQTGFEQFGPELKRREKPVNVQMGEARKKKILRLCWHVSRTTMLMRKLQRFGLNSFFFLSFSKKRPLLTLTLKYKSHY